MQVSAALTLEVEGIVSTLSGDGDTLVLHSADPAGVLGLLAQSSLPASVDVVDGPRAIGRAGDLLESAGLRLELVGPHGTYLTLGRGTSSTVGRVVTRSSHVQPGKVTALRPLLGAELARRVGRPQRLVVLGVAVVAVVWRLARRRPTGS